MTFSAIRALRGGRTVFLLVAPALLAVLVASGSGRAETATPIKYLIVILQENRSFDHYLGTYPEALNPPGEPRFEAKPGTPQVDGLKGDLLHKNPNAVNPFRLSRAQAITCDPIHSYRSLQRAYHGGRVDRFVQVTGPTKSGCDPRLVMGHYDGNTVTALWTYAQHFAMSDRFFSSGYVPSTPGVLNVISGQTHGASPTDIFAAGSQRVLAGTVIGNARPLHDDCGSEGRGNITMRGKNVGDLLNERGVTWGHFQGGFRPTAWTAEGKALCRAAHETFAGQIEQDYSSHHEPFQYYASTANPHHLPPTSLAMIGRSDQANHQYDLQDFWAAVEAGNLPAVSFLRASRFQDGHPLTSSPLAEQAFLVETLNRLGESKHWPEMAVIVVYDDSGGWYDHAVPPMLVASNNEDFDVLQGSGRCGRPAEGAYPLRCGFGPRLPFLVVSLYAKPNFVDHTVLNHASILRFIEDNWGLGRIGDQSLDEISAPILNLFDFDRTTPLEPIFLDPSSGLIVERADAATR